MTFVNSCCLQTELPREAKYQGPPRIQSVHSIKPMAYRRRGVLLPNDLRYDATLSLETAPLRAKGAVDGGMLFRPLSDDDDVWISFGAPRVGAGAKVAAVLSAPSLARAQSVSYANPNFTMEWEHYGHGVRFLMRPRAGWQPDVLTFPIALSGLEWKGAQLLHKGEPVARLGDSYAYDEADPMGETRPIKAELIGGDLVLVVPSLAKMGKPVLHPELVLQPDASAGKDTYLQIDQPSYNSGVSIYLAVGERNDGTGWLRRTLIQFNLTSLPDAAIISSTTLGLYCCLDFSSSAATYSIYRQLRAWDEGTQNFGLDAANWNYYDDIHTWQTAGGFGASDCEQTAIGSRDFTATETLNKWKYFSLTPTTKAGLDLGNGWLMKSSVELNDCYYFYSSDYATDITLRPKATFIYTLPGGGILQSGIFVSGVIWSGIVQ